jgi:hypothetical protein
MRWSIFALLGVGTFVALTLGACGHKKPLPFGDDGGVDDDSGTDQDGDLIIDPAEAGEGGSCANCSADLHNVLDCDGNVIMSCPPNEGCGPGGQCVPACDSARANQSTIGCDYYAVNPGSFSEFAGACYAVYIANTWTSDVTLNVTYGGMALNVSNFARIPSGSGTITYSPLPNGKLPAGKFAILFLSGSGTAGTNCPQGIQVGVQADTASPNTEIIKGFRITSSAPVQAFDIFPYGGSLSYGSSATLLLPVSAWGTNYLGVHGYTKSMVHGGDHLFLQIASDENANAVTISPTAAIVGGNGVAPTGQGQPHTYNLNKGDVLQFMQDGDLSGSPIKSTKPVGLWGGNQCFNVEATEAWCDSAHQQVPPIAALGHEYVAVKHRDRTMFVEEPPWRILGAVDGTKLSYIPSAPTGAPTTIKARELVKFTAAGPFVVKSQDDQHPFYISAHMRGQQYILNQAGSTGDPEYVNVIPPQQFLDNYIFMTDPTMAYTSINLIRDKAKDGTYKDVKLDCLSGNVTGWKPITGTTYQYTVVNLVDNAMPVGQCNNGLHTVKSMGGTVGLTVWGWDQYVSYAYPGGASVKPINTVVVIPTPN